MALGHLRRELINTNLAVKPDIEKIIEAKFSITRIYVRLVEQHGLARSVQKGSNLIDHFFKNIVYKANLVSPRTVVLMPKKKRFFSCVNFSYVKLA